LHGRLAEFSRERTRSGYDLVAHRSDVLLARAHGRRLVAALTVGVSLAASSGGAVARAAVGMGVAGVPALAAPTRVMVVRPAAIRRRLRARRA